LITNIYKYNTMKKIILNEKNDRYKNSIIKNENFMPILIILNQNNKKNQHFSN